MKATIDIPEDLMREIKVKAARENRKLRDLFPELLRRGLDSESSREIRHRVKLPLIETAHPAAPGEELTPDQIKDLFLQEEAEWALQQ